MKSQKGKKIDFSFFRKSPYEKKGCTKKEVIDLTNSNVSSDDEKSIDGDDRLIFQDDNNESYESDDTKDRIDFLKINEIINRPD